MQDYYKEVYAVLDRIKLTVSYNGANYSGYQTQPGVKTIQGEIESALFSLYKTKVTLYSSGRTDEGVHALNLTCHYDAPKEKEIKKIEGALNFYLPPDIRVSKAEKAGGGFHSRFDAKSKTYFYDMYFARTESPFLYKRALMVNPGLDIKKMKKAAKCFKGAHDFKAFRALNGEASTSKRKVFFCKILKITLFGYKALRLKICADGFLYKMVRIITAAVISAGEGLISVKEIKKLLKDGREWDKKKTAPPHGLYLYKADYYKEREKRLSYDRK